MVYVITGGTGFVGSELVESLTDGGHQVRIITRNPEDKKSGKGVQWFAADHLESAILGSDAVINLAGENLFGKRWTESVKKEILRSRVDLTKSLVAAIHAVNSDDRPKVLVSASAVGYYGDRDDEFLPETANSGNDFLAEVCRQWEAASSGVPENVRVVNPRIGIVLHPSGGALQRMLLPFRMFVGGPLGNGHQFFPWIHRSDLIQILRFCADNPSLHGAVNAVAPDLVRMKTFAQTLGNVLGRPSVFPVPVAAMRILLGEAADSIVASQRAIPENLQEADFKWQYPNLQEALQKLLS